MTATRDNNNKWERWVMPAPTAKHWPRQALNNDSAERSAMTVPVANQWLRGVNNNEIPSTNSFQRQELSNYISEPYLMTQYRNVSKYVMYAVCRCSGWFWSLNMDINFQTHWPLREVSAISSAMRGIRKRCGLILTICPLAGANLNFFTYRKQGLESDPISRGEIGVT